MSRQIILIRHGESEGNVDWRVMATVPDHKLALTEKGRRDGFDAGRKLKGMIGKNDRVRFYVSPYLRARQTLDEILKSFRKPNTAADGSDDSDSTNLDDADPPLEVPFDVKEEPRLREQDWGDFQLSLLSSFKTLTFVASFRRPSLALLAGNFQNFEQMELIKAERAAYGPFYYRIPHGESGADVHDRVSIFLDSLVRTQKRAWPLQPTVIVIVTHGLLARLFAMRFMRLSVDEFESWRCANTTNFSIRNRH